MKIDLEQLAREAEQYRAAAYTAESTRRNYASDWKDFENWCRVAGLVSLPAATETVVLYLSHLLHRQLKISTTTRHAAAINYFHSKRALGSPASCAAVKALLQGAQRVLAEKPHQKRAISVTELRAMSAALRKQGTARAIRDRSILTLGLASALRRSNLVALDVDDVEFIDQGAVLRVSREKQDQMAKGRYIGIPKGNHPDTCPVATLRDWLQFRCTDPGPLYTRTWKLPTLQRMHPSAIATVVKGAAAMIGLDITEHAGHSLRSGLVTAAYDAGVSEPVIQAQTGHQSTSSLRRYFRRKTLFPNASAMIGL